MSRRVLLALGAGAALLVAVVVAVLAVGSTSATCAYPEPLAVLPAALRAQGGFDQAVDPVDAATIDTLAQSAATSLHPDLVGVLPARAVTVRSADGAHPDALIVPMQIASSGGGHEIAALAVFLRDCGGRLHYSDVRDFGAQRIAAFPSVDVSAAEAVLGPGVDLVYSGDPTRPVWRSANGSRETPAG